MAGYSYNKDGAYMAINKIKGKKEGKQKYRVRINYVDIMGKYRQVERTAYGLEDAKTLEITLIKEYKENKTTKDIDVKYLFNEYIESKKAEIRTSSLKKDIFIVNAYILPDLEKIKLKKLNSLILQKWKNKIQSDESNLKSIKSRQNVYGVFRAMLNYAVKMGYLQTNPLIKIGNFKVTVPVKKEIQFYTPEEFKAFINAAEQAIASDYDWNYYIFFCIAFYTGMRKGEIYALQWKDIKDNCICVTKSLNQKLNDVVTAPKNEASIRNIQIPIPLKTELERHLERYQNYDNFSYDFYICGGSRPVRDTSVQNKNREYAKCAGLKAIRLHDFRHSHASLLCHAGINIQEIARRLGHSKVTTTLNTYSHLYPSEQERAIEVLNKI